MLPGLHRLTLRLQTAVRSRLGLPNPWVNETLLGRALQVRDGVLRPEPDYDDAWLLALARHSRRVFDIGSNTGQAALLVLLAPPVERIVLVDPNREALAVAAENLIVNGLSAKAQFVPSFVSDASDETVELWTVGTGAAGSIYKSHAVTAARVGTSQRVPTVTFDDLCDRYFVPDLVKVDVEGAELKVLAGANRAMKGAGMRFLVEMHSPPELPMAKNADGVLAWCAAHDYAAWYLAQPQRLTDARTIQHRGRCHLLLQPASWPFPPWLEGIKQSAPLESLRV